MAAAGPSKLQALTQAYGSQQSSIESLIAARQALDSQLSENLQVQREFAKLKSHNQVYKLIGGVLLKQEQDEARGNVDKRLEFIKGEITRVEDQLKTTSQQAEKLRAEIMAIQQAAGQGAPTGGSAAQ
ncbi:unnamed protein product [Parajaminaea phylloscopi]